VFCFLILYVFSSAKSETRGRTGSAWRRRRREEAQIMYTHASKCKNCKVKLKKKFQQPKKKVYNGNSGDASNMTNTTISV
jgi:hypothetical protein